jgi:hypothetical protein
MATNSLTQNYRSTEWRKLEWLQHVIKMDQTKIGKEVRRQKKSEKVRTEMARRCRK